MGSEDFNSLRGQSGARNVTSQWVEDFILENSTVEQVNYTRWINGTAFEPELSNDDLHLATLIFGLLLMVLAMSSNVAVFIVTCYRIRRETKFRSMHLFLCNLAVADMSVSAVFLPAQAGWITTSPWKGGEVACRIFAFFRIFGRYLSSFIVICISVDRVCVVFGPLHGRESSKKALIMASIAWVGAIIFSFLEAILHHIHSYPHATWLKQCTIFGSFASLGEEITYFATQTLLMCGLPLVVILVCYTSILWKMCRSQAEESGHCRRGNALARTKKRTVKLYLMIVLTFFTCWTPSFVMKLWFWIEPESAITIDPHVWKVLSLFESTSSCFNPIIYGYLQLKRN